ncbi:MAG: radical SAM protein [Bdellovibrionota bacterium]
MNKTKSSVIDEILAIRKNLPKDFCPVPFTTIILEPDGKVGLCRNKGNDFPMGQLTFNNIEELWDIRNSEKAMKWRQEFLDGKVEICKKEVQTRKCNLDLDFNYLLPDAELAARQTTKILRLTANFNGKCNMQCPFCTIWTLPNGNYTDENFWIPARTSLFPYIKQIDMLSGEPFIQADTYKLMDIITELNPECQWIFTTNMYWNLSSIIEEKLDKINLKAISVSIDSLKEDVYARLRPPGKLKITLSNLEKLLSYRKKRKERNQDFVLGWNFLVQKDNWMELPEVFRFAEKNGIEFFTILLHVPSHMSIMALPEDKRREIFDFYLTEIPRSDLFKINPVLMPLAESLSKIDKAAYISSLKVNR